MGVVVGLAWFVGSAAAAQGVRPLQPRGVRVVEDGMRRCETFRELAKGIAGSDLVVYVTLDDRDPDKTTRVEARVRFAGSTAAARYLEVWLQPRDTDDRLIVLLAHELQHAVELAAAPRVRSAAAFRSFYEQAGRSSRPGRYCTTAAEQVTRLIAGELHAGPAAQK